MRFIVEYVSVIVYTRHEAALQALAGDVVASISARPSAGLRLLSLTKSTIFSGVELFARASAVRIRSRRSFRLVQRV